MEKQAQMSFNCINLSENIIIFKSIGGGIGPSLIYTTCFFHVIQN